MFLIQLIKVIQYIAARPLKQLSAAPIHSKIKHQRRKSSLLNVALINTVCFTMKLYYVRKENTKEKNNHEQQF